MPHHFLYHYNAYHIVIIKPPLPRFYLYYIQKISAQVARYLPKLASITAKNGRYIVGAGAAWSGVGTLGSNTVNLSPKGGKKGQESSKSGIMSERKKKELSDVQITANGCR